MRSTPPPPPGPTGDASVTLRHIPRPDSPDGGRCAIVPGVVSRRVRRRRRQVAVGLGVLVLSVVLLVALVGGSGRTPPAAAPRHSGTTAAEHESSGSTLSPTWRGDGKPVVLAFGGDVHFEGVLGSRLAADPQTALGGPVAALMAGSNLAMADFESALTDGTCPSPQPKQYVWYAPTSALAALKSGGLALVSMANEHGEDCGPTGLEMSLSAAASSHFPVIGIGSDAAQAFAPYRTTVDGQRIAVFAATQILPAHLATAWTATATGPGVASATDDSTLIAAVQEARRTSDTVVVYLFWGTEPQPCPNATQKPLAEALVRAGADIVVGAGTHVQDGAGYLGQALVDYGLGNLAFYDTAPPETSSGSLVVTVTGRHIDSATWRPALISGGVPQALSGAAATAAVQQWKGLRACTGLAPEPGPARATVASETPVSRTTAHRHRG